MAFCFPLYLHSIVLLCTWSSHSPTKHPVVSSVHRSILIGEFQNILISFSYFLIPTIIVVADQMQDGNGISNTSPSFLPLYDLSKKAKKSPSHTLQPTCLAKIVKTSFITFTGSNAHAHSATLLLLKISKTIYQVASQHIPKRNK